jgi:ferredoxin
MCIATSIYPFASEWGSGIFLLAVTCNACFPCSQHHPNTFSTLSQLHNHAPKRRHIDAWYRVYNIASRAVTTFVPRSSEQVSTACVLVCPLAFLIWIVSGHVVVRSFLWCY